MAEPDLHESAWDRAKAAAGEAYRSTAFQVSLALSGLICVSGAVIFTADSSTPVQTQIAVPILAGVIGLLIPFLAVLALQAAKAPLAQRNELRRAWDSEPLREPVNVELTLLNYARTAEDNADSMAALGNYTKTEEEALEEWTDDVARFLSAHAPDHGREFIEAGRGVVGVPQKSRLRAQKLRDIADKLKS